MDWNCLKKKTDITAGLLKGLNTYGESFKIEE